MQGATTIWALIILASGLLVIVGLLLVHNLRRLRAQSQAITNVKELLNKLINAYDTPIYLKDADLKYVLINQAGLSFYGKTAGDVIGRSDSAFRSTEICRLEQDLDREVLDQQKTIIKEIAVEGKTLRVTKFPVKLVSGACGVGTCLTDITEKHRACDLSSMLLELMQRDYSSSQEQLDYALTKALELTQSKLGCLFQYDQNRQELLLNSWSSFSVPELTSPQGRLCCSLTEAGVFGKAIRQKNAVIINDCTAAGPHDRCLPFPVEIPLTRFTAIPVIIDGAIVAALGLANKDIDYDHNDVYQATALINAVWNAKDRREKTLELEQANKALQEEKEKLQLILDSAAEAIYGIDLDGRCTFCNQSCLRILGYADQGQLLGKNMHWLIHHSRSDGTPLPRDECKILTTLTQGKGVHVEEEVLWRADGSCFHADYYSFPQYKDGKVIGAVVTFTDITARRRAEAEITYLSYHDPLTDLFNRRYLDEQLSEIDVEENLPISVIMGDADGLKLTNDIFGHETGDLFLKKTAGIMKSSCRKTDIVVRLGGDEFLIILPKTPQLMAERVAAKIKNKFTREQINVFCDSISLGTSTKTSPDEDIWQIIAQADKKMYTEKLTLRRRRSANLINTIISTLHAKSPYEAEHAKNVSLLCEQIGTEMNLPLSELNLLKEAGYLHNIGKVILDEKMLNTGRELSERELQQLRQHPVVGYKILSSTEHTLELAQAVLNYCENWDGTGYPQGLSGKEIPKLARIIAIADYFDTLVNGSPGRAKLGKKAAAATLQQLAGTRFDPEIVELFVAMLKC